MNDFMYEMLQNIAARIAYREHTSDDSDSYESDRENLLTKELTPGNSHSSQFWYMHDVLEKYHYYLEHEEKKGIKNSKYVSQFSNKVSYSEISTLTYDEIADLIYQSIILSNLPSHAVADFYGCERRVPIYPIKSLLDFPEVETELKRRIVKHYIMGKNHHVTIDISSISFELKNVDGGDYLIISFPAQINYEDSIPQFDV